MQSLIHLHGVRMLNRGDVTIYEFKFVDEDDEDVYLGTAVTLEGYEIPESGSALAEEDTLLEALGKLEARVAVLED